jgi:hypothetical protein
MFLVPSRLREVLIWHVRSQIFEIATSSKYLLTKVCWLSSVPVSTAQGEVTCEVTVSAVIYRKCQLYLSDSVSGVPGVLCVCVCACVCAVAVPLLIYTFMLPFTDCRI